MLEYSSAAVTSCGMAAQRKQNFLGTSYSAKVWKTGLGQCYHVGTSVKRQGQRGHQGVYRALRAQSEHVRGCDEPPPPKKRLTHKSELLSVLAARPRPMG